MAARSRTLQELVVAAASVHSDRVAVIYDDGSASACPVTLFYSDLVQLSSELSRILRKNCSPNCGVIGLYCNDDLFIPVWILGILASPAAYVPLDPEAPGLLSARVMNQCGLKYCAVKTDLLQASLVDHMSVEVCTVLPKFQLTMVLIRPRQAAEHEGQAEEDGVQAADGAGGSVAAKRLIEEGRRDLAYVLHTSGTTGRPKIVRVPHKCILPNIVHLRSLFQVTADDVVFLASPLTFDPSVVDMFLALSSGARLLVVPSVFKKRPGQLARLLFRRHNTTVMQVTPTLLLRFGHHILKEEVLSSASSLRVLALGGEACPPPALLRSWRDEHNKTSIYNIYGITEVSCWACCHKIPESVLQSTEHTESFVPLGAPLMDTIVEVRDDQGGVVTEGEGQVFIGGEERVCLLDKEEAIGPGTMRATGDWVNVNSERLQYLGRRDRLIKRHGKRVNLDSVQQLMLRLPQVEACAVALQEGFRLLAFVVLVLNQLSLLLPSYSVPDALLLVPALPLTPHGKQNKYKIIVRMYVYHTLFTKLAVHGQEALGLPEDVTIDEDSNFLLSGGDSLKALHLHEDILAAAGEASPELLEIILDGTFSDVLSHVTRTAQTATPGNRPLSPSGVAKRHTDLPNAAPTKRERKESKAAEETWAVKVLRRAGEVVDINIPETSVPDDALKQKSSEKDVLDLSLSWSSDTGRCVDASPVLLLRYRTDQCPAEGKTTVIIGSHSHRIQALDLISGSLVWERVLGGRIEASAAVSRCGSLVVVGCYDGCVYFLCTVTGETRWIFKTGDAVKSSPAVDPVTGLVIVGSHDGTVYGLNPECVWRRHCGGGAVYSSPYLQTSLRQLYVASLGGHLLCLNPESGEVLWSHSRDVPFFSSPNGATGHVLIGSVDGNICCLNSAGKPMWEFLTNGPVFSSPCVTPDLRQVLCGSHDGSLYCLNCADGSLAWSFRTTGKVFSSPCVFDGSAVGRWGTLVGLASTDGTVWVLDGRDGRMLASLTLTGELFSSPVVWGRSLVVGCRNDFVYCLNLTVKDELPEG
uniref:Aminoadipate-semialdehyde dehydrogenase n=1 Tax=Takifugu rubripes TaxID=31033 RepID=H2UT81_TAKRU